jgi:hypothetical protein
MLFLDVELFQDGQPKTAPDFLRSAVLGQDRSTPIQRNDQMTALARSERRVARR